MYVKVESERLRYITLNQQKLRAESYIHLQNAVNDDANDNPNDLGQFVIIKSPRHFHDVCAYGRPDLFLTFTHNPSWKEITAEFLPGQRSTDRHDLIAIVFRLKVQIFVEILTKGSFLEKTYALYFP